MDEQSILEETFNLIYEFYSLENDFLDLARDFLDSFEEYNAIKNYDPIYLKKLMKNKVNVAVGDGNE